jgi:hypothetical protein
VWRFCGLSSHTSLVSEPGVNAAGRAGSFSRMTWAKDAVVGVAGHVERGHDDVIRRAESAGCECRKAAGRQRYIGDAELFTDNAASGALAR